MSKVNEKIDRSADAEEIRNKSHLNDQKRMYATRVLIVYNVRGFPEKPRGTVSPFSESSYNAALEQVDNLFRLEGPVDKRRNEYEINT